jgi:hypothetical protein
MAAINLDSVPTHSFDWGVIKWMVSPDQTPGAKITFGEVVLLPGQGHIRHNHPHSEEILYVLSGSGEQMVDDKPSFAVRAGRHHLYSHRDFSLDRQYELGAASAFGALQSRRGRARADRSARLSIDAARTRAWTKTRSSVNPSLRRLVHPNGRFAPAGS